MATGWLLVSIGTLGLGVMEAIEGVAQLISMFQINDKQVYKEMSKMATGYLLLGIGMVGTGAIGILETTLKFFNIL